MTRVVFGLAGHELRVRYRQSLLKAGWAFLNPVLTLAVYGTVLTQSFHVRGACSPYVSTAWLGLVFWTYFSSTVGGASTSILSASDLVSKVAFPRVTVPLSIAAASLVDLAVGMAFLVAAILVQGVAIGPTATLIVLPLAVILVWSSALGIFVGVLAAFSRDVVQGVSLLLRIGFFLTPVMYEARSLPRVLAWTASVNPIAAGIGGIRDNLLCRTGGSTGLLSLHLLVGVVVLVAGARYTRAVEDRIADMI